jgi:hypothetical protein
MFQVQTVIPEVLALAVEWAPPDTLAIRGRSATLVTRVIQPQVLAVSPGLEHRYAQYCEDRPVAGIDDISTELKI